MGLLDGKKIVNNMYAKAKELDIKIGDIEKEVPVSLGYISRFLKNENNVLPSLEALFIASKKLNVPLDFLLLSDYSRMNEEETLLQNKISTMIINTQNEKYLWKEIRERDFYMPITKSSDGNFHATYPFVSFSSHYNSFGDVDYVVQEYYSRFLEKTLTPKGSMFSLKLDSNVFYIAKVLDDNDDLNDLYYELYVWTIKEDGTYKLFKLVNATYKDKFYNVLEELYNNCVLKSQEFRLDVCAKNALASIK